MPPKKPKITVPELPPEEVEAPKKPPPEEKKGVKRRLKIEEDFVVKALVDNTDIGKEKATEIKGIAGIKKEDTQELLEIINMLRSGTSFEEIMSFLRVAKESKEPLKYIVFKNPTLDGVNGAIREQQELEVRKPTIRQGLYKCPECKLFNTMHYQFSTRGDEAAKVFVDCLSCKKTFRG